MGLFAAGVVVATGAGERGAYAQPAAPATSAAPPSSDDAVVVARVGDKTITLGELNTRIHAAPAFVLRRYGSTPEEIKKNFLDQVIVREVILTEGAIDAGFDKRPEIADRLRAILRTGLFEHIKKDVTATPITDADVKQYYEENRDKYSAPHRLNVWRILVDSESEARDILREMKKDADLDTKKWSQLARDKSVDKGSAMRSGNIGYLNPDGTTGEPELQYSSGIFEAADKVKDGELVPDPIKEGDKWAVVWRKQGMRAVSRSLEGEATHIRATILDERIRKAIDDLVSKLRSEHVSEVHPELCDMVTVSGTGEIERAKRPGVLPRPRRMVDQTLNDTPAGLR
jgi:peptidyl-prolyl cis-trans isomerase C